MFECWHYTTTKQADRIMQTGLHVNNVTFSDKDGKVRTRGIWAWLTPLTPQQELSALVRILGLHGDPRITKLRLTVPLSERMTAGDVYNTQEESKLALIIGIHVGKYNAKTSMTAAILKHNVLPFNIDVEKEFNMLDIVKEQYGF